MCCRGRASICRHTGLFLCINILVKWLTIRAYHGTKQEPTVWTVWATGFCVFYKLCCSFLPGDACAVFFVHKAKLLKLACGCLGYEGLAEAVHGVFPLSRASLFGAARSQ